MGNVNSQETRMSHHNCPQKNNDLSRREFLSASLAGLAATSLPSLTKPRFARGKKNPPNIILKRRASAQQNFRAYPVKTGIRKLFADPPCQYSSAPLWVWNDMLTEKQVISTLQDLAGQKVKQVFVHPRPGLMTPYLSTGWFKLWKVALKQAERLDMNLWIYDENSYPSGFAGGLVPDAMPEARGRGLVFREEKDASKLDGNFVAVFRLTNSSYENVTASVHAGKKLPEGSYLVAAIQRAGSSPWYGGKCYVDLLYPGVTEKFLSITMEAYRQQVGEQFGKRVPGVFTDEPHIRPAGGLPWTDDLPQVFARKWGYSLIDCLPSLARPLGHWKRVRHNYFQVLLELFIERWAKPYYDYCQQHKLQFTGHYWEHEWPNCLRVPDNMAMYAWQQRPAIDILMNRYSEDTHAQFGNVRAVKELSSAANQLGRERTLCEAFGAGGWDLRFEDMKRIGDWLFVLGVTTLNEHLSFITIRGARKRDHPQSFSYHTPWWKAYHVMASYFTRLSLLLSQGEQINKILLIEPTTTAWMYQADSNHRTHLNEIGNRFQQMVLSLARTQLEYDIGCEDIIARHGSAEDALFKVGQRQYETVLLPPLTENLNSRTMELLNTYLKAGGTVICCGPPPSRVDGQPSDRGVKASLYPAWKKVNPEAVPEILLSRSKDGFVIQRDRNDKGILFHHRRHLQNGQFLFLVNTSIDSPSAGKIQASARGLQQWDPQTATISVYPFTRTKRGIKTHFQLPPCGSLLLFLTDESRHRPAPKPQSNSTIAPEGPPEVHRLEDNVLTLDYVDVTAGGQTRKNIYFYRASQFVFAKHGLGRNPWDNAVQFRNELIKKKFPAESGFTATYRFTLENKVPNSLYAVIERPDLYSIRCNGLPVSPIKGAWWLDKSFGKIDIQAAATVGENTVTLKASPFTIYHELEPAYILGDFALQAADSGFVIVPQEKLKLDARGWNQQAQPFYAAGVSYTQKFNIPQPVGQYAVQLPHWYGSVAEIMVNGQPAGYIAYQPAHSDVTPWIKPGTNTIEIVVIGTLKNTLGPHHAGPVLGAAWPNMFQRAPETGPPPGSQYHTISYGLFQPFVLVHKTDQASR